VTPSSAISATIRDFRPEDAAACLKLYREGLIGGTVAENDTGLDVENIPQAYLSSPRNHFWVAEDGGQVVGMVGVQSHEDGVGEIRRLRVRKDHHQRGIGMALMETALKFCLEKQYLKVMLDTYMEREPAMELFARFGFRHLRTRQLVRRALMYFYLDLYAGQPKSKREP